LAADLGRFLRAEPIHARSISRSERTLRWCKRNPVVASLLAVSVILLFVSLWSLRGESRQRKVAGTQRVAADTQREDADIQRKAADANRQTAEARLWESLLEQSRSNRLAGNREKSFTAIKEAHRIKPDKKLRTEAIQTIVAPGVTLLHQLPVGWVHSTRFSDDSNLLMVEGSFYEKLLYDQGGGKFLEYSDPPLRDKSGGLKIFRLPQAVEITSISKSLDRVSWVIGESDYTAGRRFNMAPYLLNTDSNLLAVNLAENGKHNIHLWELPSGREAGVLPAGSGACCTFSPSGKFLATEEGGVIELWDLAARTPIRQLGTGRPVAFLTDDDLLVSRKWPNFSVVNTSTGFDMRVGPEGCSLLAIDSQARITVWRGSELNNGQSLRVWNLADNHEVAVYKGQVSEKLNPVSVQISPSGRHVAFDDWGRPGQFTLWDTESGIIQNNCQGAVYGPGDRNLFQHGVFSSEGTIFVAYSKRGNATSDTQSFLKLWDVKNGREFASIENGSCPIISRNGRWLATISPDKDWPSSASSIRNRRCVRI